MGLQTTSGLCSAVSQSVITAGNSLPMNIYHNYCTINTYIHIYIYIIFLRANQNQLGLNSFSLCQNSHHCPHSSHKTKGQSSWMFLSRPTLRNLSRQGQAKPIKTVGRRDSDGQTGPRTALRTENRPTGVFHEHPGRGTAIHA